MGVKIVIAEDETGIRNNLRIVLGMEGFAVFAAPNGKEALAPIPVVLLTAR